MRVGKFNASLLQQEKQKKGGCMQPILGPQQSIICNKPRNQFADQINQGQTYTQ